MDRKYLEAWAGFVWELRRCGYWGDPERYKGSFEGYFYNYFHGISDSPLEWYHTHCCEGMELEEDGPMWDEWSEEDKKKVRIENDKILKMEV